MGETTMSAETNKDTSTLTFNPTMYFSDAEQDRAAQEYLSNMNRLLETKNLSITD
ncbi:hypothetical protein METBIDRAFT_31110, partial [Metschnikowia bicuspidata var. bicuspidata NRRL YB-4993]